MTNMFLSQPTKSSGSSMGGSTNLSNNVFLKGSAAKVPVPKFQASSAPVAQPSTSSQPSFLQNPAQATNNFLSQPVPQLNSVGDFLNKTHNSFNDTLKSSMEKIFPTPEAVKNFISQVPELAKSAVKNPIQTVGGVGQSLTEFGGDVGGAVEHGIASAAGIKNIPERWDMTKQNQGFKDLVEQSKVTQTIPQQQAIQVGHFIGNVLPYALASEATEATIGKSLLTPAANKFLPAAAKFVPLINNAIAFTGVGQIEYNRFTDGSRVDRVKTDLTNLALFEVGGALFKGLTAGTKGMITNTIDDLSSKFKSGESVPLSTVEQAIKPVNEAIKTDTGKSPASIVVDTMTGKEAPKVAPDTTPLATYKAVPDKSGDIILEPQTKPEVVKQGGVGESAAQTAPQTPIGEGTNRTSKLGLRVEQTAIEKKLTSDLGDLPQYKQMDMKDQAKRAADLLNTDPDRALRIAMGDEKPPEGLQPESVFKAMENSVTTPELAKALANSPLVSEATAMGQRIKALDVNISDSPVEAIKQVIDARAKAVEEKFGKSASKVTDNTINEIKDNIKAKAPDKYDWAHFLEEIKCK